MTTTPAAFAARLLAALFLLTALAAGPAAAQDAEAEGPTLPSQLLQPGIPTDELALRLVPLTKDELAALAERWLAIVKAKTGEVVETQLTIASAEGDAAAAARARLADLTAERKSLFDKYSAVVSNWEAKGGDEALIADYRA